jgi:hypothetical protein
VRGVDAVSTHHLSIFLGDITILKSYEAIYDHGRIKWLGEAPVFKRVRVVLVADDVNELEIFGNSLRGRITANRVRG